MKKPNTFTKRQLEMLNFLDAREWRKLPLGTKAGTIISLMNRGLVDDNLVRKYVPYQTYRTLYEFRLSEYGAAVLEQMKQEGKALTL